MYVRLHRAAPADGITGEQQETAEGLDLVKLEPACRITNLDAVFLGEHRHEVATVAFAIALNAADLVEIRGHYPGVGVTHAGKGEGFVGFYIGFDQGLARFHRPFVHAGRGIMDVAIEKLSVIRIKHDLPDGRAGAFRNDAVNEALAFRHPRAGETHPNDPFTPSRDMSVT